ncbi:MAG: glycosyltransferase [Anaerolineae bacterium]|nr:glycosyltransferase [Anaerolineae bacterium]
MRILFLTQILPYPPDAGPKFKTWQVLRYLVSRGHQVTLVSMVRAEELPYCRTVQQLVSDFHAVSLHRSRINDGFYLLRSLFTRHPFLIERDNIRKMRQLVRQLVMENDYDAIHADQLTMTQFVLPFAGRDQQKAPLLLFDAHNATWKILERYADESSGMKRWVMQVEADRLRRYEADIVSRFDFVFTVSAMDRAALMAAVTCSGLSESDWEKKFRVIPITVDTQSIQPVDRAVKSGNIFTMGTLHYPPNADGIRWFINEIFPLVRNAVPGVTLTIVGKNPPADFVNLQKTMPEVFHVPGYVPDLTPWFAQAAVMIVPVRIGGGMRVRILEAFARGMPVVTTTVGLEGIEAISGEHVLVADDPGNFAGAVIDLLRNEQLQQTLGNNGRKLVEQHYDQQIVLRKLDELYPPVDQVKE